MEIIEASSLGFCFGVRDAVDLALREAARGDLIILGELVHNPAIQRRLQAAGVQKAPPGEIRPGRARLMITAHGTSDARRRALQEQGHQLLDATCPLVLHAHRALRKLIDGGYYPVIAGAPSHPEVVGLTGDAGECTVIESTADFETIPQRARIGVISQTTGNLRRVRELVQALKRERPEAEIRFIDTICAPTRARQAAVEELAGQCDMVVVVGGSSSNNSRELVETSRAAGADAILVETADDLDDALFLGCRRIGLTAGASTPDEEIDRVRQRLHELADKKQGSGHE